MNNLVKSTNKDATVFSDLFVASKLALAMYFKWDDNSKIQAKNAQLILLPKLPSHGPAAGTELYSSLVHSSAEYFVKLGF